MIEFCDQVAKRQLIVLDLTSDLRALPSQGVEDVRLLSVFWDDWVFHPENIALSDS